MLFFCYRSGTFWWPVGVFLSRSCCLVKKPWISPREAAPPFRGCCRAAGSAAASRMQQGARCWDRQSALQQKMGAAPSWGILAPFPPVWGNRTDISLSSVNGRKLLFCKGQLASLQGRSSQFSCASCFTFPTLSSVVCHSRPYIASKSALILLII